MSPVNVSTRLTRVPLFLALALLAGLSPSNIRVLRAQGTPSVRWTGAAEANGSVLYGSASQRVISAAMSTQRLDDNMEARLDAQASYGDSRRVDGSARDVIVRTSSLRGSLDLMPASRWSPFGFASVASSLQQRYTYRLNVGAGAKYTFWRPNPARAAFPEDASVSVAALFEDTRTRRVASIDTRASGRRARWSVRARYRRQLAPALRLTHTTYYQPSVSEPGRYTVDASTVLGIPLREHLDLTITHRERLDSEATARGAPSNRDGQLLFGVRAQIR